MGEMGVSKHAMVQVRHLEIFSKVGKDSQFLMGEMRVSKYAMVQARHLEGLFQLVQKNPQPIIINTFPSK